MILHVDAIYDNGVLKPLQPLALADQARVTIAVDIAVDSSAESESLRRQQEALDELRAAVDQLPPAENPDGWSVRQHDAVLYGAKP